MDHTRPHSQLAARVHYSAINSTVAASVGWVRATVDQSTLPADYASNLFAAETNRSIFGLRIVYLDLLSPSHLRRLADVGIGWRDAEPGTPFYWARDTYHLIANAVWTTEAFVHSKAVENHGWAEITHCPSEGGSHTDTPWGFSAAWAYVAPGSGVSVNVGRTLVLEQNDFFAALRRAYPEGSLQEGCTERWRQLNDTNFRSYIRDPLLRQYDSIQLVSHKEYFSAERRHEIVLFRYGECQRFNEATRGLRCGRHPHFVDCTGLHFGRFRECQPSHLAHVFDESIRGQLRGRIHQRKGWV